MKSRTFILAAVVAFVVLAVGLLVFFTGGRFGLGPTAEPMKESECNDLGGSVENDPTCPEVCDYVSTGADGSITKHCYHRRCRTDKGSRCIDEPSVPVP